MKKQIAWVCVPLIGLLLILIAAAHSQTAILLPDPHPQFFDNNGNPLAGGKIFTFLAGTAIAQVTYTDSTASTPNTNPIILNSAGFPTCSGSSCGIYLTNGVSYRIVVQNSLGVQQWVADNVKLVNSAQVGGANTQVQYNCAGAFCGSPNLTWNNGSQTLTMTTLVVNSGGSLSGTFGGNPVFSGTVTFSGTVNFSALTANSMTSTACGSPALTGFLRLCRTDAINWRNNGNTADEGLSTDGSDRFIISHTGGTVLTGLANLLFGGSGAGQPMIKRNGTVLNVRLADDSNDAGITASTVSFNGNVAIGGACASGQVLTATGANSVSCQAAPSAATTNSITTLGADTGIGAAATTWVSKAVTMPSTGCPCRALVSYGAYFDSGDGSGVMNMWVSDGTSDFASTQALTNAAGGQGPGAAASSMSPNTYSNGAVITFSAKAWTNGATVKIDKVSAFGSAQNSWMAISIFSSN